MIGVFDSGNGGLSVLKEIIRVLPDEKLVYYADTAHCPYGEKSRGYIIERCKFITSLLLKEGASTIVVACNTATAAAISTLRSTWPEVPFVGIEPAVKPAALGSKSGVIGVLATKGTLSGGNYLDLREKYSDEVRIAEHVGEGFVELVEKYFPGIDSIFEWDGVPVNEESEEIVRRSVCPMLEQGADTLVLGCTHYPFLENVIKKIAGSSVKIINPAPAVAAQTARLHVSAHDGHSLTYLTSLQNL